MNEHLTHGPHHHILNRFRLHTTTNQTVPSQYSDSEHLSMDLFIYNNPKVPPKEERFRPGEKDGFWEKYDKVASKFDGDMLARLNESLNNLLIFVSSRIMTMFKNGPEADRNAGGSLLRRQQRLRHRRTR